MKSKRRFWISLLSFFAAIVCVAGYYFSARPPSFTFPDGTVLLVTAAKVGFTNEFKHGSRAEKLLGDWIGTNGWTIGNWNLQRPEMQTIGWPTNAEHLAVEFKWLSPSNTVPAGLPFRYTSFFRSHRIVHWGDDGFRYTEEFPEHYFAKWSDGYFGYLATTTFSRTSKQIHIEFQQRESREAEWKNVAALAFPNPKRTAATHWRPQSYPVTNVYGDFTAVLGPIQVQQPRDHVTRYRDIWQHAVDIPFRIFLAGQAVTNWAAEQMAVSDATGNDNHFGAFKSHTNGWIVYRGWRSATPSVPWRLRGHFTEESDFAASNLFTVRVPVPLNSPVTTNLAGLQTTMKLAGHMLDVRIPENTRGKRIVLVDAVNDRGESVKEWTGSWSQHGFHKSMDLSKGKGGLNVTLAIVRDIEFEFVVQPMLVQQIASPSKDLD